MLRLPIKSKFLLSHLAAIALTCLLLGVFGYFLTARALAEAERQKLELVSAEMARTADQYIEDTKALLQRIELFGYHKNYRELPLSRHFAKFREVVPGLSYLNAEGREEVKVIRGKRSENLLDFGSSAIFEQALRRPNQVVISDLHEDPEFAGPVLRLALAKFAYFGDEYLGTVLATIPLAILDAKMAAEVGRTGFYVVIDRTGTVLLCSAGQRLVEPIAATTGGGPDDLLQRAIRQESGFGRSIILGKASYAAYAPAKELGWSVLAVLPAAEFLEAPRRLATMSALIGAAVLLVAAGIVVMLADRMTAEIDALIEHTEYVAAGDLQHRLEIASGDEIEELARSFNFMTESIRQARQARESLHTILQSIIDPLLVTDRHGLLVTVNPAMLQLLGYSRDELVGLPMEIVFGDHTTDAERFAQLRSRGSLTDYETTVRTKSGRIVPVLFSYSLTTPNTPEKAGIVGIIKDITDRKLAEKEIELLAYYDSLTGLPNRQMLRSHLERAISRSQREHRRLAVMFLDLDNFKTVNDTLGHPAGDQLLAETAQRLRTCVRTTDTVSRLGGDEFVILLEQLHSADDISRVGDKVIEALAQPFVLGSMQFICTASVGIAVFPDDGTSGDQLLKNADMAMYHTKSGGRNAYAFFSAEMNERVQERHRAEAALAEALPRRQLILHFQPKIDLASNRICGAEALVRWQHPEQGLLAANDFIGLAEETGLSVPLGAWALAETCRQSRLWRQQGLPRLRIAVNLTGQQLQQKDLTDTVAAVLAEAELPAGELELELTGNVLANGGQDHGPTLQALKELGITLSINDFGTGCSSLASLHRYPLDMLTIAPYFIDSLCHNAGGAAIAKAIITLAHSLGLRVTAEGVETSAQLDFLRRHGCDEAQGNLLGRPLPADEFVVLLHQHPSISDHCN